MISHSYAAVTFPVKALLDSRRVSASYDVPLLVLPHLRPPGTSVGGKLLGTGASCIVTAVLKPCATTSLRVCDLAQIYPTSLLPQLQKLQLCASPLNGCHGMCVGH